jgi:hypothetical protein
MDQVWMYDLHGDVSFSQAPNWDNCKIVRYCLISCGLTPISRGRPAVRSWQSYGFTRGEVGGHFFPILGKCGIHASGAVYCLMCHGTKLSSVRKTAFAAACGDGPAGNLRIVRSRPKNERVLTPWLLSKAVSDRCSSFPAGIAFPGKTGGANHQRITEKRR